MNIFFIREKYNRPITIMLAILLPLATLSACTSTMLDEEACENVPQVDMVDTQGLIQFDAQLNGDLNSFTLCGDDGPLFDNRFSPYKGGALSPDLVVEYWTALQCPHCAHFEAYVDELLREQPRINNRVRFYFHHYAWNDYVHYHQAAFAISQQGMDRFWQFHDILQANTNRYYDYLDLHDIAQFNIQADMSQYDLLTSSANAEGAKVLNYLEYEKKVARAHCVTATPTVFLCGKRISDWRELNKHISAYFQTN
ncbi:MAG: thioredoxin domain-containing protein [Deltaproteobacteria bacterium]|nr:thioredoxin domain-containing protein [Deltaproteobacteria bacterium]